jgi:hypothetical protein
VGEADFSCVCRCGNEAEEQRAVEVEQAKFAIEFCWRRQAVVKRLCCNSGTRWRKAGQDVAPDKREAARRGLSCSLVVEPWLGSLDRSSP